MSPWSCPGKGEFLLQQRILGHDRAGHDREKAMRTKQTMPGTHDMP